MRISEGAATETHHFTNDGRTVNVDQLIRGLRRLHSTFWTDEDVFSRMDVTVEVYEEPTTPTVRIAQLKQWIKAHGRHPREEAKKRGIAETLIRGE